MTRRLAVALLLSVSVAFAAITPGCKKESGSGGSGAAGSGGDDGTKGQTVNLLIWSEYLPQAVADRFTEKTGIKLTIDVYDDNEALLSKLQSGVADYDVNKQATPAEMRAYVCGQCHVEYYFRGPEKRLVFPWSKGLRVEQIQAYWPLVMGLIFIAVIVLFRGGLAGMVESTTGLLFRRNRHGRPA